MVGIASAATAVVIGYMAGGTSTIRVGAGGIMLPNHSPLVIAEQFGTLESLYPGRIDLGLGRAPGTDQRTLRALAARGRRGTFPQDVLELQALFGPVQPGQAHPGRAGRRDQGADVDSGIESVRRAARRACSGCHMPLPRTSRPMRCIRRWRCIARASSPRRNCRSPMPWRESTSSPRRRMRRRAALHLHAAAVHQSVPGTAASCSRPSTISRPTGRRGKGAGDAHAGVFIRRLAKNCGKRFERLHRQNRCRWSSWCHRRFMIMRRVFDPMSCWRILS